MKLEHGAIVGGKYRLDRRLGAGGMGEVWAAAQTVTRKPVALKFLLDTQGSPDLRRRFMREARAACAVRHPNVVEIHDVIELDDGSPAMVMELLRGESLEQRLQREGKMAPGELAAVALRVVAAVGTAHALGIVHRDLKPDNIFLAESAEGIEVKVLDFGIAKLTAVEGDAEHTGGLTNTGAMLGTPYYMSPEQAFGEKAVDHRADIWSLGIILYRGLTGVLPTRADNLGQILKIIMVQTIPRLASVAPEVPADLAAIVDRMLTTDAAGRPSDLREVKAVLERHAGITVEPFSAPTPPLARESIADPASVSAAGAFAQVTGDGRARRRLGPAVVGGVAVVALAAAGVVALTGRTAVETPGPAGTGIAEPATTLPAATPTAVAATAEAPLPPPPPAASSATAPAASTSLPVGPRRPRPGAAPAATAVATASASTPSTPAPARTSLGGVIEKPTF